MILERYRDLMAVDCGPCPSKFWVRLAFSMVMFEIAIWQPVEAANKAHSATQRYGDVIITRNADGTIESRDAAGPTYSGGVGAPTYHSARQHGHRSSVIKSAAHSNTENKSSGSSKAVMGNPQRPVGSRSNVSAASKKHAALHHIRSAHRDDVVIIRNADGSVEVRDAQ